MKETFNFRGLTTLLRGVSLLGFVYGVYQLFYGNAVEGISLAITFGAGTAPSQSTFNYDAVFAQSVANYRRKLIDNIGSSNVFFHKMIKGSPSFYEEANGGTHIEEELMYALTPMDSYDGYDELSTQPTDGITNCQYEWRSAAAPISYSKKEERQNRNSPMKLVKNKIMQAELGLQEGWSQKFLQGSGTGALETAAVSAANGSSFVNPLPLLIKYDPTSSTSIGNLNQNTHTWWRNRTDESGASTFVVFLTEMNAMYNTCGRGAGGPPDLILCDQRTYELFVQAWFSTYRTQGREEGRFPFENTMFKKALVCWDENIPDVYSGLTNTDTYGSMYFINTQFFRVRYDPEENFEMLKDENGKIFTKPANQSARVGHVSWSGQTTTNQRRKQGVIGKIARTMT